MNWKEVEAFIKVESDVPVAKWAKPGTENGLKMLESFVKSRLKNFGTARNDPTKNALSNLSPWFHAGNSPFLHVFTLVLRSAMRYHSSTVYPFSLFL